MRRSWYPLVVVLLSACAPTPPPSIPPPAPEAPPPPEISTPVPSVAPPVLTIDGYKKRVADRIARANADFQADSLPEMLRSVVVLNVTIDRHGQLANVSVRRSNGFKQLENRALESVRRAAPFDAPGALVRRGDAAVTFLETFLFRDDGRYQLRSLQN